MTTSCQRFFHLLVLAVALVLNPFEFALFSSDCFQQQIFLVTFLQISRALIVVLEASTNQVLQTIVLMSMVEILDLWFVLFVQQDQVPLSNILMNLTLMNAPLIGGDPSLISADFMGHLGLRHQPRHIPPDVGDQSDDEVRQISEPFIIQPSIMQPPFPGRGRGGRGRVRGARGARRMLTESDNDNFGGPRLLRPPPPEETKLTRNKLTSFNIAGPAQSADQNTKLQSTRVCEFFCCFEFNSFLHHRFNKLDLFKISSLQLS